MAVLVGKQAPDFTAKAAVGSEVKDGFTLSQFKGKKYVVLFFYPLDFTFVCPTELHAFQEALGEFNQRNAQVVGCSIDSVNSHLAWLNTSKKDGGIQGVTYPIVADLTKQISRAYDVLDEAEGITYRGTFIIDKPATSWRRTSATGPSVVAWMKSFACSTQCNTSKSTARFARRIGRRARRP